MNWKKNKKSCSISPHTAPVDLGKLKEHQNLSSGPSSTLSAVGPGLRIWPKCKLRRTERGPHKVSVRMKAPSNVPSTHRTPSWEELEFILDTLEYFSWNVTYCAQLTLRGRVYTERTCTNSLISCPRLSNITASQVSWDSDGQKPSSQSPSRARWALAIICVCLQSLVSALDRAPYHGSVTLLPLPLDALTG